MQVRDCHAKVSVFALSQICLVTVNYIYFLLSGSKCLWFTSMENITLISL